MKQQNKPFEIYYEYQFGNLHKIFFRREHKTLFSDYDKYLITNEGKKGYYAVYSINAFNELWFEMSAKTLKEIIIKYGLAYDKYKENTQTELYVDGAMVRKI